MHGEAQRSLTPGKVGKNAQPVTYRAFLKIWYPNLLNKDVYISEDATRASLPVSVEEKISAYQLYLK